MPPKEGAARQGAVEDDDDEWEDEGDWQDENCSRPGGISGRKGAAEELPEGWTCTVNRGEDQRFVVKYLSKDGTSIKSKGALRTYLQDRGVTGSLADDLIRKADFSQRFARRFILLNSTSDCGEEGDTSRDELIALAMQRSYDHDVGLDDDDDDDEDYDGSSVDSFDDSDEIGDVAAGGWRMRQQEETAQDYDISCLEIKTLGDEKLEGSCPVCQCDWEAGDEVRILPCEHQFHTQCIDRWLQKHKANCPLCKKDVREDWEDEEEEVWDPLSGTWKSASDEAAEPKAEQPEGTA